MSKLERDPGSIDKRMWVNDWFGEILTFVLNYYIDLGYIRIIRV